MAKKEKNIFISHYGKDDEHVQKLKTLLDKNEYTLKNSSMDSTKPNQAKNPEYIKDLLRSRIKWAGATIVLIGPKTHTREWVDYEIDQSQKMGNRIIGLYIQGETGSKLPDPFEKYADALIGWDSKRIIDAIEGNCNNFENPDGTQRDPHWHSPKVTC